MRLHNTYGYHNYFINILQKQQQLWCQVFHTRPCPRPSVLQREPLSVVRHILRLPATRAIAGFKITQLLITIRPIERDYIIVYVTLCTVSGIVCGLENAVVVIIFTHRYIIDYCRRYYNNTASLNQKSYCVGNYLRVTFNIMTSTMHLFDCYFTSLSWQKQQMIERNRF